MDTWGLTTHQIFPLGLPSLGLSEPHVLVSTLLGSQFLGLQGLIWTGTVGRRNSTPPFFYLKEPQGALCTLLEISMFTKGVYKQNSPKDA